MNIQTSILFITAFVNSVLSIFVLSGDHKDKKNIVYSIFVLFSSLWSIGLALFILENNIDKSIYIANFYYFAAIGIPVFFLYFSYIFPKNKNISNRSQFLLVLHIIIFGIIFFVDKNIIIENIIIERWGKSVLLNTQNYILYALYFIFILLIAYFNLLSSYFKEKDINIKNQLKFLILGTSVGFLFGMYFNLILPFFGNYRYIFLGPIFSISMVGSIAYSITKHKLFNTKLITTEITIFILWVVIFIRFLLANSFQDRLVSGIVFLITVFVGVLLAKSVIKEVEQKEKIKTLADNLLIANDKLKELDQMKSEFLSLATHQIRAPLTAIKGYASLIIEGDYGDVPEKIKSPIMTIFDSCQNLVSIVNDFLDISRIEQGRMKYEKVDFDIVKVCKNILDELMPNISSANLKADFYSEEKEMTICADVYKIKQIIGNVIDNSIKYTKSGNISVSVLKVDSKALIKVKDTGVGIAKEDIVKLFGKFVRAKDASKTNVIGTGLGLYIAKQMLEAQGGKIWVESEGLGKGSTFFIEIPLK